MVGKLQALEATQQGCVILGSHEMTLEGELELKCVTGSNSPGAGHLEWCRLLIQSNLFCPKLKLLNNAGVPRKLL